MKPFYFDAARDVKDIFLPEPYIFITVICCLRGSLWNCWEG